MLLTVAIRRNSWRKGDVMTTKSAIFQVETKDNLRAWKEEEEFQSATQVTCLHKWQELQDQFNLFVEQEF